MPKPRETVRNEPRKKIAVFMRLYPDTYDLIKQYARENEMPIGSAIARAIRLLVKFEKI